MLHGMALIWGRYHDRLLGSSGKMYSCFISIEIVLIIMHIMKPNQPMRLPVYPSSYLGDVGGVSVVGVYRVSWV